jgi:hypothetical protein
VQFSFFQLLCVDDIETKRPLVGATTIALHVLVTTTTGSMPLSEPGCWRMTPSE